MTTQILTYNTFEQGLLQYLKPRVTQCAAMMAEIVLDLTLGVQR